MELLGLIIATLTVAGVSSIAIVQQAKIANLRKIIKQQGIDMDFFSKEIVRLGEQIENAKLEKSDGFIKFLSESRDWAFTYIEDIQKDLTTLFNNADNGKGSADDLIALKKYLPEDKLIND